MAKKKRKQVRNHRPKNNDQYGIWISNKTDIGDHLNSMMKLYAQLYLERNVEIEVSDSYWEDTDHYISEEPSWLYQSTMDLILEAIHMSNNHDIKFKIYSKNHSVYFMIGRSNVDRIVISVDEFIQKYEALIHRIFYFDTSTHDLYEYKDFEIVYSPKEVTPDNESKVVEDTNSYVDNYSAIMKLYEGLRIYLDRMSDNDVELTVHHIPLEIHLYNVALVTMRESPFINTVYGKYIAVMLQIHGDEILFPIDNKPEGLTSNTYNYVAVKEFEKMIFNTNIPVIDLNSRDWSIIHNYIKDNNYLYTDDPVVDLSEKMSNQRYGDKLRYLPEKGQSEYIFGPAWWTDDGIYRIVFRHKIPEDKMKDGYVITFIDIDNANNLRITDDADISYTQLLLVKAANIDDWPMNDVDRYKYIPPEFRDTDAIRKQLQRVISLYSIIYDRPDMLCMSNNPRSHRNNTTEENTKADKPKHTSKKAIRYITRKIYDRSDSSNPVERKDAEYSTPEWQRIGYWRVYKKTGKKVWVKPVVCKRHLPITTDRETHIKL